MKGVADVNTPGGPRNKISIDVHLVDAILPLVYSARDWDAAQAFLGSSDFHELAGRVELITLTSRER